MMRATSPTNFSYLKFLYFLIGDLSEHSKASNQTSATINLRRIKGSFTTEHRQPAPSNSIHFSLSNVFCSAGSPLRRCRTTNLDGAQPIQCSVSNVEGDGGGGGRREAMGKLLFSVLSFPLLSAKDASAETGVDQDYRVYEDEKDKFRITVPRDWVTGVGDATGFKSITAFFPQEASDSNVTIAITGLGPDFTRLESFGKVDAFAESLVSGLDRSWTRPPGVVAKLINSTASNGFYYIEYTLQNPGEKCRHIFSALGLASNGWYNRLYTVTGQFIEGETDNFRSKIEKSVSSFRFI